MNEFKIVIEGLKELTEAVNKLAAQTVPKSAEATTTIGTTESYINPPVQQPSVPVQTYAPVTQPVSTQTPITAPAQGTVPTTAVPQTYTIEQLQVAAAGLTSMGKMPAVMGILQNFGIQAMTELPKERYGEFALALREAGAQI